MIPLSGTSTGAGGKASPHLQAWYDEKKAAEEKRKALEGDDSGTLPLSPLGGFQKLGWLT